MYALQGEVHRKVKNDTLIIAYDLLAPQLYCDSIVFQIPLKPGLGSYSGCPLQNPESLLYHATSTPDPNQKIDTVRTPVRLTGTLSFPHPECYDESRYWLHKYSTSVDPETGKPEAHDSYPEPFRFYPTGNFGRSSEIGAALFDKYGYPSDVRGKNNRCLFHYMDKLAYHLKEWTAYFSFRMNQSGPFTYYDYAVVGCDIYPGGRESLWPSIIIASKYSRTKAANKPNQLVEKGSGIETGLRFDGRFESLAYTYSSNVGGVHRVDLSFAVMATQQMSMGTRYTAYYGKYFRMYQVSLYVESVWMIESPDLDRIYNRPLIHKILAGVVLLPYLPMLLFEGYD